MPVKATSQYSLLDHVSGGALRLPHEYRAQKSFFRLLKRAGSDQALIEQVSRLRDAIVLSGVRTRDTNGGVIIALAGPKGKEGVSLISLLLALSLGGCTQRRVALIDGRFNLQRFAVLSNVLELSQNNVRLQKGTTELTGYYNEAHPNVYFLKNGQTEDSLDFFSDKRLGILLSDLRQQFDFTLIDMPPYLRETSNLFLTPLVDRLYLVTVPGKTTRTDLKKCASNAEEAGGKVSGIVINQQRTPLWSHLLWKDFFF